MIKAYETLSSLARDYGVSRQLANNWVKSGQIVKISLPNEIKYTTVEQLVKNIPIKHTIKYSE
jgi:hypothetical protein